ncbi:response regulator [Amycolatopsis vancoresmycina]|uniref:Two-component system response regulator n=1 Tax=Amycolatopsis vancoresmycina DSM 44592 TaxID=1292037 RepID=R1H0D4_9PSEU|nr:response regulator transcription factor [Amycolatopsis vancoresmycina]EOD57155.1 two-component system response regulator [Amycolatopsis vancoresmycina DSM 44592]
MTVAREPKVTIIVADDHTLFRQGLCELLTTDPEFAVTGEAADGDEAVTLVQRHRPNILLLDVEMPGPSAKVVIERVGRMSPDTAVVILTMHDAPAVVRDLLDSGAAAYLVKSIARDELISAIRSVSRSKDNVLLSVPRATMESLERRQAQRTLLSERELEVLRLVAAAMSNAQVASRLFISEGTVKRHLTNIYGKLGAASRVDAINKAVQAGFIEAIDH